jgi:hypothetical protein
MTEPGAPWDASPLECTASGRKNKGKEAALAALCSPLPPHSTVDVERSNRYRAPRAQTRSKPIIVTVGINSCSSPSRFDTN